METGVKTETTITAIEVELKWFSVLAEHRGKRQEVCKLAAGTTGNELIKIIAKDFPLIEKYKPYIRIAINHEYSEPETELRHGDEVAFITPVSGG